MRRISKHFKEKLIALQAELQQVEQAGDEAARIVELDQSRVGRLSRMGALQAQAMSVEAKRRREIKSTRIKAALQRIDKGEFGKCLQCEKEISLIRLDFDPTTFFCIECAKKREK